MANRFPKPWYRPARNTWYVTLNGKQINLGPDRESAFRRYHDLMAKQRPKRAASGESLFSVIDAFLEWCQQHRAEPTYKSHQERLQRFIDALPGDMPCQDLRPYHVQQWVDSRKDIANGTRRNYILSVQRAMNWAVQQGYIDHSPIPKIEKPARGKREVIISPEVFGQLLQLSKDQGMRDLLNVHWETGCRPQESLRLEARHVDLANSRWIFPANESKGQREPRIVYLTETAAEITERLATKWPEGKLFRNRRDKPWSPSLVNCRFSLYKRKIGRKYCLYHFRHTWINRMLLSGVDALTVAVLAGHRDPSILARHYQHLSQDPRYLKEVVRRPLTNRKND